VKLQCNSCCEVAAKLATLQQGVAVAMPYTTEVSMTLLSMEIFQISPTNIKCKWQISPKQIEK
jgi:hypothetical protein